MEKHMFKLPDEATLISSWKMVKTRRVQLPRCESQLFRLLCHHGQVSETFSAPYLLICKMGITIVPTTWDGSQGFNRTVPSGNSLRAVGLHAIVAMDVRGDWSYLWLCLKKASPPWLKLPILFYCHTQLCSSFALNILGLIKCCTQISILLCVYIIQCDAPISLVNKHDTYPPPFTD